MKESVNSRTSGRFMNLFGPIDTEVVDEDLPYLNSECRIVDALFGTIALRDPVTANHSMLMAYYSHMIALEFDPSNSDLYFIGGLVHDIGKISMRDLILKGDIILDEESRHEIKSHVSEGYNLLRRIGLSDVILRITRYHHERFNGEGYLEGLKGYQIPIEGRISAVADTYSTLIEGRAYSRPRGRKEALDILRRESYLFDPDILKWFLKEMDHPGVNDIASSKFLINFSNSKIFRTKEKVSG